MNRQELEKKFDEKFLNWNTRIPTQYNEDVKQFIFETIIPKVLKSVILDYWKHNFDKKPRILNYHTERLYEEDLMTSWNNICIDKIKQKVKELYNITL